MTTDVLTREKARAYDELCEGMTRLDERIVTLRGALRDAAFELALAGDRHGDGVAAAAARAARAVLDADEAITGETPGGTA